MKKRIKIPSPGKEGVIFSTLMIIVPFLYRFIRKHWPKQRKIDAFYNGRIVSSDGEWEQYVNEYGFEVKRQKVGFLGRLYGR